jgi:hypothetical protein
VCTPNCQPRHLADGTVLRECAVGFTCLSDQFRQTDSETCAPGFAGWPCLDTLGCGAGECHAWQEVGGPFAEFKNCEPLCDSDDDCVPYQGGLASRINPNAYVTFTCQNHHCQSLQSLFFNLACLRKGDICKLDPTANCVIGDSPPPPSPGACSDLTMLGAIGSSSGICVKSCASDGECDTLTAHAHVTFACAHGVCLPAMPYILPCTDDHSCMPTLKCLTPTNPMVQTNVCTISCASSTDCAQNPALGSAFACIGGQCVPRTESGCAAPGMNSDACLSGRIKGANCVSPKGWFCDADSRCESGTCDPTGHCT